VEGSQNSNVVVEGVIRGNNIWGLDGKGAINSIASTIEGFERMDSGSREGSHSLNDLDPTVLLEVEESLKTFLPSYREVLTRSQIPIFVGGELLINHGEKIGMAEGDRGPISSGRGDGDVLIKGEVLGGLEK
jgi:hypothetical protein